MRAFRKEERILCDEAARKSDEGVEAVETKSEPRELLDIGPRPSIFERVKSSISEALSTTSPPQLASVEEQQQEHRDGHHEAPVDVAVETEPEDETSDEQLVISERDPKIELISTELPAPSEDIAGRRPSLLERIASTVTALVPVAPVDGTLREPLGGEHSPQPIVTQPEDEEQQETQQLGLVQRVRYSLASIIAPVPIQRKKSLVDMRDKITRQETVERVKEASSGGTLLETINEEPEKGHEPTDLPRNSLIGSVIQRIRSSVGSVFNGGPLEAEQPPLTTEVAGLPLLLPDQERDVIARKKSELAQGGAQSVAQEPDEITFTHPNYVLVSPEATPAGPESPVKAPSPTSSDSMYAPSKPLAGSPEPRQSRSMQEPQEQQLMLTTPSVRHSIASLGGKG